MKRFPWLPWSAVAISLLGIVLLLFSARWWSALEVRVEDRFEGALFSVPSRIYSRPLHIRAGMSLEEAGLEAHLGALAYRRIPGPDVEPGEFAVIGRRWILGRRAFHHARGVEPALVATLELDRAGLITSLRSAAGAPLSDLEIEPLQLGAFYGETAEERELISLEEVPEHLVAAILAIEDRRFFEHGGFDLPRMGAALAANLRARRVVQGGSTITQQLVKNLYLTRERTLSRKLREAAIARILERNHSKREILEAYLNEVYLGQRGAVAIHGVGRAARHYFGKDVLQLDLSEAALLAGILRGPSLYSPSRNPNGARDRRDLVLAMLHAQGRISEAGYTAARDSPLVLAAAGPGIRSAGYFVDQLRGRVAERFGSETLEQQGLSVFTTLDPRLQRQAERAVTEGLERLEAKSAFLRRPDLASPEADLQAALVALHPRSGDVVALIGGRDYGASQFNRATEARRQPGSVFKTIAALAALSRQGAGPPAFTLASVFDDVPLRIPSADDGHADWTPANHDGAFRGQVTLRQVVEDSLNVPMAQLGMDLGLERIIAVARRLGIRSELRPVPSLSLGTFEVTLLEITRAYGVLAAAGLRPEPRDALAVRDAAGELVAESEVRRARVFDAAETYLVTSALQGAVERGTGRGVRALGFRGPVAGKTGTTDDYRDAWFIGYTPDLVVGVWVGFDDGHSLRLSGARAALPIFADFLSAALGSWGGRDFVVPPGVAEVEVAAEAGYRAGLRCDGAPEVFLAATTPSESCRRPFWLFGRRERVRTESSAPGRPPVRVREPEARRSWRDPAEAPPPTRRSPRVARDPDESDPRWADRPRPRRRQPGEPWEMRIPRTR